MTKETSIEITEIMSKLNSIETKVKEIKEKQDA